MTGFLRLACLSVLVLGIQGAAAAQTLPLPFDVEGEARELSVTVTPSRSTMRGLPRDLRTARGQMHGGEEVSDAALMRLAEAGDGLAAHHMARRLIDRGDIESRASDLAYYSAIAVGTGRVWTLPHMIEAMHRLDPDTEPRARLRKYIQVLYPHAWAGNPLALDAVIAFNGTGRLFGELTETTRARIMEGAEAQSDGRAALRLALILLEARPLTAEAQERARGHLRQAEMSPHPGIRSTAKNLAPLVDAGGARQ